MLYYSELCSEAQARGKTQIQTQETNGSEWGRMDRLAFHMKRRRHIYLGRAAHERLAYKSVETDRGKGKSSKKQFVFGRGFRKAPPRTDNGTSHCPSESSSWLITAIVLTF